MLELLLSEPQLLAPLPAPGLRGAAPLRSRGSAARLHPRPPETPLCGSTRDPGASRRCTSQIPETPRCVSTRDPGAPRRGSSRIPETPWFGSSPTPRLRCAAPPVIPGLRGAVPSPARAPRRGLFPDPGLRCAAAPPTPGLRGAAPSPTPEAGVSLFLIRDQVPWLIGLDAELFY